MNMYRGQPAGSWKEWVVFLTTARSYKYPFYEQMIYVRWQTPPPWWVWTVKRQNGLIYAAHRFDEWFLRQALVALCVRYFWHWLVLVNIFIPLAVVVGKQHIAPRREGVTAICGVDWVMGPKKSCKTGLSICITIRIFSVWNCLWRKNAWISRSTAEKWSVSRRSKS